MNYWRIEFNERKEGTTNYAGLKLTKKILDEIRQLDRELYIDKNRGYYKFYFEHIKNKEIIEKIRVDIGDFEKEVFDYLEQEITYKNESIKQKIKKLIKEYISKEFENEEVPEINFKNKKIGLAYTTSIKDDEEQFEIEVFLNLKKKKLTTIKNGIKEIIKYKNYKEMYESLQYINFDDLVKGW